MAAFFVCGVRMLIQIAVIVTAIVVGLLVAMKAKQFRSDDRFDFASREVLFTPGERSFLGVLEQALGRRYRMFGKVRLGDVVKPANGLSNSKRFAAQKKSNRKHVDFLVCS